MPLSSLPPEIWLQIYCHLSCCDALEFSMISRFARSLYKKYNKFIYQSITSEHHDEILRALGTPSGLLMVRAKRHELWIDTLSNEYLKQKPGCSDRAALVDKFYEIWYYIASGKVHNWDISNGIYFTPDWLLSEDLVQVARVVDVTQFLHKHHSSIDVLCPNKRREWALLGAWTRVAFMRCLEVIRKELYFLPRLSRHSFDIIFWSLYFPKSPFHDQWETELHDQLVREQLITYGEPISEPKHDDIDIYFVDDLLDQDDEPYIQQDGQ